MQSIPKDRILKHHPDTMITIRKEYNLDKPGRMEDAIRIIREWVEKQKHFKKKDFTDFYLETLIVASKGSLERSKKQIDRMCTLRTLLPQFFQVRNPKTDFGNLFDIVTIATLPKLTPDNCRVLIFKINDKVHLLKDYLDMFVYSTMIGDYLRVHDYCHRFINIADFTEMNLMDFLANLNPIQIRQILSILIEGYGMRLKGVYIYTSSTLVDTLVTLLKQLVSPKIANRIHTYKTLENICDIVPANILPVDYGGQERSLNTLLAEWNEIISSEENLAYLKDLSEAGTDESCRKTDTFNNEYAGLPGSFRVLTVD